MQGQNVWETTAKEGASVYIIVMTIVESFEFNSHNAALLIFEALLQPVFIFFSNNRSLASAQSCCCCLSFCDFEARLQHLLSRSPPESNAALAAATVVSSGVRAQIASSE